jgi:phosphatidylserine/phosphatidylglycerophosphate/cardiolipin synthase-like enzyme
MDLDESLTEDLAGFAINCTRPDGTSVDLRNRLNFSDAVTATTTPSERKWTSSFEAPFQKFRWVHFPGVPGAYDYKIAAMYFDDAGLRRGPQTELSVELSPLIKEKLEIGFTRGYISSQAYAEQFNNAPVRPATKTIDFDTAPYEKQYAWLGAHARKMVFEFLKECIDDPDITVDLYAYDLDEPDFIAALQKLGPRLRALVDDSSHHEPPESTETQACEALEDSAGPDNVTRGHFGRFAHNKVLIQKRNGTPVKVLTGSANFSVRGFYVQSNNVLIFDDPPVADLYEEAFVEGFENMRAFRQAPIATKWHELEEADLPARSVSFSPHDSADVSLQRVHEKIKNAKGSVLFAVMELGGTGDVLDELKDLGNRTDIFSYGVSQSEDGLSLFKSDSTSGIFTTFSYLPDKVPDPFKPEWSGGPGQVIHHKFVIVDFNGDEPHVFTGSSNLAAGGEEANADNLIHISDPDVASRYAVEAIRLVDHYHFRAAMKDATEVQPLTLQGRDAEEKWWEPYYDDENVKYYERLLLV